METPPTSSLPQKGKSLLGLPDEVLQRIYELVIYDHDRGVVLLPRAVPRKATPATDVAVKNACVFEDGHEGMTQCIAWPVNQEGSFAAGVWIDAVPPI